jgi:hypothetical protein
MLMDEEHIELPPAIEQKKHRYNAIPIKDYWDLSFQGEELKKVEAFKQKLEEETLERTPEFLALLESFFGSDPELTRRFPPNINITNTIGGNSGRWEPGWNGVLLPIKLSLPYYLGEVQDMNETPHWTTFGHELAHYILIAQLSQGNQESFSYTHSRTSLVIEEFFARLGERAIGDSLSTAIPLAKLDEFKESDAHRVFVLADEVYEKIASLSPEERQAFFQDMEKIKRLVEPYEKVYREANS